MALVLVLLVVAPPIGAAQTTLLVRVGEAPRALDHAVAEALRDQLGGGVRRVELTLEELALAAGCEVDAPASEPCVRTIAAAAGATLVALERVHRAGPTWRVEVDVRRADGTHLSTLRAACEDETSCAERIRGGQDEIDEADDLSPRRVASASRRAEDDTERPGAVAPSRSASMEIVPLVVFGGATLLGLSAIVAGGISLQASQDAAALGVLRTESQVDRAHALESEASIALAVGIVLASCGAGLAAVGGGLLALHAGPSLEVGLGPRGLVVRF